MAEQNAISQRTEFEPPLYGGYFILLMVLLAFATLGLHAGLTMIALRFAPIKPLGIPQPTIPIGFPQGLELTSGNSAVFDGELWVCVATAGGQMGRFGKIRAPSSRLVAFDLQAGIPRETSMTLTPSPLGLLVHDDVLWAVSEDSVCMIKGTNVISRYPKRYLNAPTKPFLYQNQLAVIDKMKDDSYVLLTWNQGEWTAVGIVQAPPLISTSRWNIEELRVISDKDSYFLLFSDGRTISFHQGIPFLSEAEPASALNPENQIVATYRAGFTEYPGWTKTPISANWGTSWDAAFINGELCAFSTAPSGNGTDILQFRFRDGLWKQVGSSFVTQASSFSVVGGDTGYLVGNDLHLHRIDGLSGIQRNKAEVVMTDYTRVALAFLIRFVPYLIATTVLVVGTTWLMARHRNSDYLYGKRTVTQASVLRRGLARGVDTVITVFPAAFWFVVAVTTAFDNQTGYGVFGTLTSVSTMLFSTFGIWLGSILVLSYVEGRSGITPGKWLCGIRTMRTTLRPCGMIRSLARELLIYADSLFLLLWLPGVLLIAFMPHWQRLGDLASDTVVIRDPPQTDPKR